MKRTIAALLLAAGLAACGTPAHSTRTATIHPVTHCQREYGHNPGQPDHWALICQH